MAVADSEASQLVALEYALAKLETRKAIMKRRQQATLAVLHKMRKLEIGRQVFQVRVCACWDAVLQQQELVGCVGADSNLLSVLSLQHLQGWKDVCLRSMVAQTTHAAMLAQQQVQSFICAAQIAPSPQHKQHHRKSNQQQNRQAQVAQVPPPRLYFTALAQQQQRRELLKNRAKQETDESEEGPECSLDTQTPSLATTTHAAAADADWKRWRRVNSVVLHQRKEDAWGAAVAASLPLSPTFRMRSASFTAKQARSRKSSKC